MEKLIYEGQDTPNLTDCTMWDIKLSVAHTLERGHMDDDEMREIEPGQQFIWYQFLHQDV